MGEKMATVKKHQIKLIHVLKSKAGIDQDLYVEMLGKYGVKSSKELSWTKANLFIEELSKAAGQTFNGYHKSISSIDMASADQRAMIEGMWADVSRKTTAADRKTALNHFLERFGVSHIEWLPRRKVGKVVTALIAMGARSPEEYIKEKKVLEKGV